MVSRGVVVEKKEFSVNQTDPEEDMIYVDSKVRNTKKYITQQKFKKDKSLYYTKYKVRVPLIHGSSGDASAIPDAQLPFCTFCPLPGSQSTVLNVGDTVYVAIVDFRFDELVIIGCVPKNQYSSESGSSFERIQYLSTDPDAHIELGSNITIGDGQNSINYTNLSALSGFTDKLTEHTWSIEQGGTGVAVSSEKDEDGKRKVRQNFDIYSTVVLSQSEFDNLTSYQKQTIYYIYEDDQKTTGTRAVDSRTRNLNEIK